MAEPVEAFLRKSLDRVQTRPLRALWHSFHGNWEAAHEEAQAGNDRDCAWIHASLHREEGDDANARYWYQRANRPVASGSVQDERREILRDMLEPEKLRERG